MNVKRYFLFPLLVVLVSLYSCQHVDKYAQIAADQGVIDRDSANAISLTARAFGEASEKIPPDQAYFIGRSVAANILSQFKLWEEDPELTKYLNLICRAIVINTPQSGTAVNYFVAILDSDEINAFATSGGHILVTRGLIRTVQSEDALAGVIAHEIAHIQLLHSIQSIKTSRFTKAILMAGTASAAAITGINNDELTEILEETVGDIFHTMVNNGYSREQEYEADNAAICFLAAAGYNPNALIEMLKQLNTAKGKNRGLYKTHPTPVQRIYFAEQIVKRFSDADTSSVRQERFESFTSNEQLRNTEL